MYVALKFHGEFRKKVLKKLLGGMFIKKLRNTGINDFYPAFSLNIT